MLYQESLFLGIAETILLDIAFHSFLLQTFGPVIYSLASLGSQPHCVTSSKVFKYPFLEERNAQMECSLVIKGIGLPIVELEEIRSSITRSVLNSDLTTVYENDTLTFTVPFEATRNTYFKGRIHFTNNNASYHENNYPSLTSAIP